MLHNLTLISLKFNWLSFILWWLIVSLIFLSNVYEAIFVFVLFYYYLCKTRPFTKLRHTAFKESLVYLCLCNLQQVSDELNIVVNSSQDGKTPFFQTFHFDMIMFLCTTMDAFLSSDKQTLLLVGSGVTLTYSNPHSGTFSSC